MSTIIREGAVGRRAAEDQGPPGLLGITARSLVVAVLLTVATYLGITRLGFIRICWVPYVIPPVPALLFLLMLQGLNVLLHHVSRTRQLPSALQPFSRGELFLIYAALCVSLSMDRGGYIVHYLLFGQYFGTPANEWAQLFDHYPAFYAPHDAGIITGWFEGTPGGRVPWGVWWMPLLWWTTFNMVLVFTVMCLVALFRRQWVEAERLTFPLLFLPIEMTGGLTRESVARGFFRNPIMWVGFGLATAFNGLNILHAFCPAVPGLAWHIPIDTGLTEPPWRHLRPLRMSFALEVWGLSYLMSGEVLLSGWFFYFLMKMVKLVGLQMGYQGAGFPYYQEASAGACIALTGMMLWIARLHLRRVLQGVMSGPSDDDANEALSYRGLVLGLLLGTVLLVGMMVWAGQNVLLLLLYFATLYMYVLVAARVRAEAGPPVAWNHPYGFDQRTPAHLLGTQAVLRMAGEKATVLFYGLFWIGRTIFAHSAGQYFIDGLRLADYGNVRRRSIIMLMLFICVIAMMLTWWYHLDVGYRYGQALIGAKIGRAGRSWAMNWSRGQYTQLSEALNRPRGPSRPILGAYGAGLGFTLLLAAFRTRFCNFPFHPLGFILGTLYGDHSPYWWPFLLAWIAQRLTLRYGGLPTYRKLVPGFLGLAFGHIFVGGILWRIIINYFIDPVVSGRYYLNLGG